MRARGWWLAAVTLLGAVIAPFQEPVRAQSGGHIVISEYPFRGARGTSDEFIELFNAGTAPANVSGWLIRSSTNTNPPQLMTIATIPGSTVANPSGTIINPGCYYLVANNATGGYGGTVPPNLTYTMSISDNGGVAVARTPADIVDQVGQGTQPAAYGEGQRLTFANLGISLTTDVERGIERRPGGSLGHVDTNDNLNDFQVNSLSHPQNASAASCLVSANIAVVASLSAPSVAQGQPLSVFANVSAGTVPSSSAIQVTGDLSAVGGSATTVFADNGVAPDAMANDNIFTAGTVVPYSTPLGARAVTVTAVDAQARTATSTATIEIVGPAVMYLPHEVQGAGATSPLANGTLVTVRGVVTARTADGFFLQTESGMEDADPQTSEGLFVRTNEPGAVPVPVPAAAAVSHFVQVTATVNEFGSPSLTELHHAVAVLDLGWSTLPDAYALASDDLSNAGVPDQLERFEGMRVMAPSLTAVSPTGADGAFFGVLTGQARPFREPGVEAGHAVLPCATSSCNVPLFDGNPERLRVDSDALAGSTAVDLSSGATISDVTGPLDFAAGTYTLLAEWPLSVAGGAMPTIAPVAGPNTFTVASLSLDQANAVKASMTIQTVLAMPDIVAAHHVDSLATLQSLAAGYDARFFGGIGLLLKQGRVSVVSVEQIGDADTFEPRPVMLRALVTGPATSLPQAVTVIVSQLRSADGSETDAGARAARQAEAEFLADFVSSRQGNQAIVLVGDFGAFSFNDGYVDTVGTIRGVPTPADEVAVASLDLLTPDLVDADASNPAWERYSQVVNGNAQTFDHVLFTANLSAQFAGLVRPRINADFPESLRTETGTPLRTTDRDPVVAYFAFPADVEAPVFSFQPEDQAAEATSSSGAVVNYPVPDATDNLDGSVSVNCTPASGSVFALGHTGVTCSTQDAAGNPATASFTVTVSDTTAPGLTTPANMTVEAESASGTAVSFAATASDDVTPSPVVTCSPPSGSMFPLGTTMVQCSAQDAAGNPASATFTVTVQDTTAPVLTMPSDMTLEANSPAGTVASFAASASDAVTPSPVVTCSSASGSMFALGTTTVLCSTQDAAGHPASASFTVTVQDTTAPVLTMPSNMTGEATSADGRVVTFTATATDAVTTSLTVDCAPLSGSTFAVGDTVVTCAAADAAGNVATGSFTVTVTSTTAPPPVFGHIAGVGSVMDGENRIWFAFDVRETSAAERGWVTVQVRGGKGRPDRYLAAGVSGVQMSNNPAYSPGINPKSGIDTVSFSGTGWWNGAPGYRFEITASDRGEPGRDRDTFSLTVFAPSGAVVETTSGVLRDGNIKSLR